MWIRRIRPRSVVQLVVQVLGLLVALAVGLAMGSRLIIVSGASMEPTMHTGDLLIVWPDADYDLGSVVTYRIPDGTPGEGKIVVHRVVGFEGDLLVTQGDNNAEIDPWNPAVGDVIGRRRVLIPGIGTLIAFLVQPAVLASVAAGLSTAWIVARGEDDEDDDTNHPDDGEPRAVTTTDAPHRPDPVTV